MIGMKSFDLIVKTLVVGAALMLSGLSLSVSAADQMLHPRVVTHAAFFSKETSQKQTVDPQVFVKDPSAKAGRGPQGIEHVVGFRPAFATDPKDSPLFNAQGSDLPGLTLGSWLGATGDVTITPGKSGQVRIQARFRGLIPQGVYSLFENHFDQTPIGFTPLDGKGLSNTFIANPDGTASISVTAPEKLTSDNAVLLVYHSDATPHGQSRGAIGVTAHHQLIAKIR